MTDRDASSPELGAPLPEADRMLAAEYALGVLEGTKRKEAERRAEHDPAFARMVDDWHVQLSPMLDYLEDATPSPRVWRAIESEIGRVEAPRPRRARRDADAVVRQSIPAWRALGLLMFGGAFAVSVLVALVDGGLVRWGADPTAASSALVATLSPEGSAPTALARVDGSGAVTVRITVAGEGGRVPELWLIPGDGVPRSLGVVADRRATVALPPGIAPKAGEVLAVSLEPPGGSPTGAPTGPVIASGQLEDF